jgi:ABC-type branched-subunit amino acid transport system permease subunit
MEHSLKKIVLAGVAVIAALLIAGPLLPKWLLFVIILSASHGVVSLGIVMLMRSGVVSFGQGLVFAAGGYAAALAARDWGVTDAVLQLLLGALGGALIAAPFAPLLARYRGIFFAMLTLALSMVFYGLLVKIEVLGGSDGFNISRPTIFGMTIATERANLALYWVAVVVIGLIAIATRVWFDSVRGLVTLAVRENELRVEYLGASVSKILAINFIAAAALGGLGGALTTLALGHIEPNFSYWTTSGEFVFVSILAGHHSVFAVFLSSLVVELVRTYSSQYFPNSWQLVLGLFLLIVIRFVPGGLGSPWVAKRYSR